MDKKELRCAVRAGIAGMSHEDKMQSSESLCRSIEAHLDLCSARVVALFSPLHDEPQIWPLVEKLAERVVVVLPRIEGDVMNFYCIGKMEAGAYSIMEPQNTSCVSPGEIDVMMVPGVAFTLSGKRMGRGKGFYDKYMSHKDFRALKIGVCYSVQIVDDIPCEEHDIAMDAVICK